MSYSELFKGKKSILFVGNVNLEAKEYIKELFKYIDKTTIIIHGNCRGIAKQVDEIATDKKYKICRYSIDYSKGYRAGEIRNRKLILNARPELVIAISSKDYPLKGEEMILNLAYKNGIEVARITL